MTFPKEYLIIVFGILITYAILEPRIDISRKTCEVVSDAGFISRTLGKIDF